MEKLLQFINSLPPDGRPLFAGRCGTSENYLRKACSAGQVLGPALCVSIERASGGQVRRSDLRSDWRQIWPELDTADQRIAQILQQLRFMHTVIADVHDLADEKSVAPLNNIGLIRIKTQVALRVAAQSGLLP